MEIPRYTKNIPGYLIGNGALAGLESLLNEHTGHRVYLIDVYFKDRSLLSQLPIRDQDLIHFIDSSEHEITTDLIDELKSDCLSANNSLPSAVIGIGGGSSLDAAKALSNLFTNPGKASDYQGWDLVKEPGVFKIGIPTLSGTGAEASRTCVMVNTENGLKLGMNSDHTIFDRLILDHGLTSSVPRDQYFYSGMDTYIHGIESLNGRHRHALSDAYARHSVELCREVFLSEDMMSEENREKLMVASYLGGSGIANSYVGVIHPFSAGLSIVLGLPHCLGNCTAMAGMEEFYPAEYNEFYRMAEKQGINVPNGVCQALNDQDFDRLYDSSVVHEKPLANALGDDFKQILTKGKVRDIFLKM